MNIYEFILTETETNMNVNLSNYYAFRWMITCGLQFHKLFQQLIVNMHLKTKANDYYTCDIINKSCARKNIYEKVQSSISLIRK